MKESHTLALIVAYYLSKYDRSAYGSLGFSKSTTAHKEIGRLLGVNPTQLRICGTSLTHFIIILELAGINVRFGPVEQRSLSSFQDLTEEDLRDIVLEILTNPDFAASDDFFDIVEPISKREGRKRGEPIYIVRGPTGRKAEEIYIDHHKIKMEPAPGILLDRREQGCGYDFEIQGESGNLQIEVKGLDGDIGGVVFTSKEWDVAKKRGDTYFLVIVRNVSSCPTIQIIRESTSVLNPKKSIFSTVQIRWNISETALIGIKQ